ncbi:unnamed protein product [Mytilus edulis]|uniref:Uncharacterized protein n=1 Tax=Mytilus edulis TaxID=6550 RepID=A0A8S3SNR9_MYTED|nr:unnamed protein product [Mytilus edulis]
MIEVTDLTFDWLFYVEMSKQLAGIVFGPIDEKFLHAILAFCCIGVVTFIMEMVYTKLDLFNHESNYCIDVVYLSAIVLWCEELPQIGMSAYIASCREESTSLVQIIKASLLILGCLIRIFIVVKRVYSRRKTDSNVKCLFSVISFHINRRINHSFNFAGSVFVFSTIKRDGWSFKFQASTELETNAEEIWIHFIFLPPTRYLLMGDVQYNACHVTSENCSDNPKTCTEVNLKYFSAESGENDQYH